MARPSKLDQPVRTRGDGTTVTAGEAVIEGVALGLGYNEATTRAGVSRTSLHRWRLNGARLRAAETQGKATEFTVDERRLIEFADQLDRAEVDAEASRLAIIQRAAQGGHPVTKTVTKTFADGTVETTVTQEFLRPEWTAAAWFLERRIPARYAKRLEVTGADGAPLIPDEDRARELADSLRAFLASPEGQEAEAEAAQTVAGA